MLAAELLDRACPGLGESDHVDIWVDRALAAPDAQAEPLDAEGRLTG